MHSSENTNKVAHNIKQRTLNLYLVLMPTGLQHTNAAMEKKTKGTLAHGTLEPGPQPDQVRHGLCMANI